jgi:hypothetical protein
VIVVGKRHHIRFVDISSYRDHAQHAVLDSSLNDLGTPIEVATALREPSSIVTSRTPLNLISIFKVTEVFWVPAARRITRYVYFLSPIQPLNYCSTGCIRCTYLLDCQMMVLLITMTLPGECIQVMPTPATFPFH